MIRVMRLWRDGMATPVDSSLNVENLLFRMLRRDHETNRYWIEDEKRPAIELGSDWRPTK